MGVIHAARIPKLILFLLHQEPGVVHISTWKETDLVPIWQIGFIFFLSAIFILLNFQPLKRKKEITMEKTEHNGIRGRGAVLSNKHFEAAPQERLSLPCKGVFPVLPPLIIVKFPPWRWCVPTATCAFLSLRSLLMGQPEMPFPWRQDWPQTRVWCRNEWPCGGSRTTVPLRKCPFLRILL